MVQKMNLDEIQFKCLWCGKEDRDEEEPVTSFAMCNECYEEVLVKSLDYAPVSDALKEYFTTKGIPKHIRNLKRAGQIFQKSLVELCKLTGRNPTEISDEQAWSFVEKCIDAVSEELLRQ